MYKISAIIVALFLVLYFGTGIFIVGSDETAVVTRFGEVVRERVLPGVHVRLPYPFEKHYIVKTTVVYKVGVGFRILDEIRGVSAPASESEWLTGDANIILLKTVIQYSIDRPAQYLFSCIGPQYLLIRSAESAFTELTGQIPIDTVLTSGRVDLEHAVKARVQDDMDRYGTGIRVRSVNIRNSEPPTAVRRAFQDVFDASAEREKMINDAMGYKNQVLPQARGQAHHLINQAQSFKVERVRMAQGKADRFNRVLAEYRKAPSITRKRLYIETLADILDEAKVYVVGEDDEEIDIQLIGQ